MNEGNFILKDHQFREISKTNTAEEFWNFLVLMLTMSVYSMYNAIVAIKKNVLYLL